MKKLVFFDLDGTLAKSKSAVDDDMSRLLVRLLKIVKVAIISGGDWPQFQTQVLARLAADANFANLSILPTCGTKFYRFDGSWQILYAENFKPAEKQCIIAALDQAIDQSGFRPERHWGDLIEIAAARSPSPPSVRKRHWTKRPSGTPTSKSGKLSRRSWRRLFPDMRSILVERLNRHYDAGHR